MEMKSIGYELKGRDGNRLGDVKIFLDTGLVNIHLIDGACKFECNCASIDDIRRIVNRLDDATSEAQSELSEWGPTDKKP